MAALILLGLGLAGGAVVAKRVLSNGPGGMRLFVKRKNIEYLNKFSLLSDEEAALAYERLAKSYSTIVIPEPIMLTGKDEADDKVLYYGSFKKEMTRKEARLIVGLSQSQANDKKTVIAQWRKLMLKNHPDTGGSLYIASKINEAKNILVDGKKAEDGEDEDLIVDIEAIVEKEEEEEKKEQKSDENTDPRDFMEIKPITREAYDSKSLDYDPKGIDHNILNEEMDYRPDLMKRQDDRRTMFERKLDRFTRKFDRLEDDVWQTEENWKLQYLARMKQIKQLEQTAQDNQWIIEEFDDGTIMVVDGQRRPVNLDELFYHEEAKMKGEMPAMERLADENHREWEARKEEIFQAELDLLKSKRKQKVTLEQEYSSFIKNINDTLLNNTGDVKPEIKPR